MMAVDRLHVMQPFFSESKLYRFGCRRAVNWLLAKKEMQLKTNEAKKMLCVTLQTFLTSINNENTFIWSTPFLDHTWLKKKIVRAEEKLVQLEKKYA